MAILRDVPKTFTFEDQRIEINELALDVYNLSQQAITLNDLSVLVNPPGFSTLDYNPSTGVFSYTPPNLNNYLQVESDPTVPGYVKSITQTQINNWNTAYSWGDHALSGYLTGIGSFSINALLDVNIFNASIGQVLKWNGSNWVNDFDHTGIFLTDLSVTQTAPGTAALTYNVNTGVFSYTPPDLSSYLTTPYTLPIASTTQLGGVKVDGTSVLIDANGVLSAPQAQGAQITTDDTPPANPNDGDLWWKSDEGQLKIWYDDGQGNPSAQWVDTGGVLDSVAGGGNSGGGGIAWGDLAVVKPNPSASGTGDLTYDNTNGNFTYTPPDLSFTLNDLTDVDATTGVSNGKILKYNGSSWEVSADAGGIALTDLSVTQNAVGTAALAYDNSTGVFSYTPPDLSGYITSLGWNYANISSFPTVGASNLGSLGFAEDIGVLYYSNGNSWTNNRIVVTDDSNSSDFATLLANYQRTYTISAIDHTDGGTNENAERQVIKLEDNVGNVSQFVFRATTGLALSATTNPWSNREITVQGTTYAISAENSAGANDSVLRLTGSGAAMLSDDILFAGADGLSVERTDEHTITFRNAPTATQYTDDMAKDAAFTAFNGGTHQNITFTYDSVNKVINANATGGGGGGGGVTYDLQGTNNTSNQAIVQLVPSTGTTDNIEFAGGDGTVVAWDGANSKVTITSKDYVVGANASASGSGGIALAGSTFTYTPPDLSSYLTAVPIATANVLGGIKVGANLTVAADGTLDAVQGSYTLPTAGTGAGGTLGGVKVDGSTVTIDGNGVISSSGGTTVPQIGELTGTSASIADNARGELSITGHKGYVLYKINVDVESWVRIYCDDTTRQADINRSEGNDPAPGSGVIAECRTSGANQDVLITPGIMGFNNDNPRTDTIYLSINNRSGSASAITVTLTALKIGE